MGEKLQEVQNQQHY